MNLKQGDVMHDGLAFTGVYELEETEMIAGIARNKGGLLVDVGANFGYYTLLWCAQRPDNRCIAFEASPLVLPHLKENIRRNCLEGRVQIIECAASRSEGKVRFHTGPPEQTGWGGISIVETSLTTVEVPACRLDHALPDEPVTLLKIDCEGADAWVVEGATALLARKAVQHLCFEENAPRIKELGIQPGETERLLQKYGYKCEALNKRPPFWEFHAWA